MDVFESKEEAERESTLKVGLSQARFCPILATFCNIKCVSFKKVDIIKAATGKWFFEGGFCDNPTLIRGRQ